MNREELEGKIRNMASGEHYIHKEVQREFLGLASDYRAAGMRELAEELLSGLPPSSGAPKVSLNWMREQIGDTLARLLETN